MTKFDTASLLTDQMTQTWLNANRYMLATNLARRDREGSDVDKATSFKAKVKALGFKAKTKNFGLKSKTKAEALAGAVICKLK